MAQQENPENIKTDFNGLDVIHVSVPKRLGVRLKKLAKDERRSLRQAVLVLIEEALKARGVKL
jgi:hypothetical protein